MKKLFAWATLFLFLLSGCAAAGALPPAEPTGAEDAWGVSLSVKDVTASGLTLVISQSGGSPEGELNTGSPYWLQVWNGSEWAAVEETPSEFDRCWTSEAYFIPLDGSLDMEVNWEWMYGTLPAGIYRIGKTVMGFRGPGDYTNREYYAQFEIKG